ncbi:hypothetical protein UPYG_G00182180 [Umbra pygmaea]|uniref:PP1-binding domain-containing protein n=1 Tax=Umbra pygmaea TaxID=75934 RepID=A0ABD0WVL8_UMBPY
MASSELKNDCFEQNENFNQTSCPSPLSNRTTLLDFSTLTPSQLGISTQSFTPSSNIKDKTRLAQLKAKRRSNIGVRGSPETNSLIRYIAQQRLKTPPTNSLPTQAKPFTPSTLKQKMAVFQSILCVEENEDQITQQQSSHTGCCIKTSDGLSSDWASCDNAGKENDTPAGQHVTPQPPPTKRRCAAGPLRVCAEEIRKANTPVVKHSAPSQQQETSERQSAPVTPRTPPQNDPEPCVEVDPAGVSLSPAPPSAAGSQIKQGEPQATPPERWQQDQEQSFELHSPCQAVRARRGPFRTTLPPPFSKPSHLEFNPTDEVESSVGHVDCTVKKKQVRFGVLLPPELFDKSLPPSTPLRKGGTPARVLTPNSQLRSLLKTPQRTPLAQPQFCSPSLYGASPKLTVKPSSGDQGRANNQGKIMFPSMDDVDSSLTDNAELTQPLDLTSAFEEEQSACLEVPCAALEPDSTPALEPVPEPAEPTRSHNRKRKLPEDKREAVKRSTRTAAKSACGRMKTSGKRAFGKAVNRSLYGKRDYASKNPALSPIREALFPACKHTAKVLSSLLENVSVPGRAAKVERRRSDSTKISGRKGHNAQCVTAGKGGRGGDRKVSVPVDDCLSKETEEHHSAESEQEPTGSIQSEDSSSSSANHTQPVEFASMGSDPDLFSSSNSARNEDANDVKADDEPWPPSGQVSTTVVPCQQEAETHVEPRPHRAKHRVSNRSLGRSGGSRAHVYSSPIKEESKEVRAPPPHSPEALEESEQGNTTEQAPEPLLPPWILDEFSIDDVLRPVPSRGSRSVRRSLRNQNTGLDSSGSGLAWLPYISPDSIKTERRKTRGRRSSIQALQLPMLEDADT